LRGNKDVSRYHGIGKAARDYAKEVERRRVKIKAYRKRMKGKGLVA
jgi:hypothetical protein